MGPVDRADYVEPNTRGLDYNGARFGAKYSAVSISRVHLDNTNISIFIINTL